MTGILGERPSAASGNADVLSPRTAEDVKNAEMVSTLIKELLDQLAALHGLTARAVMMGVCAASGRVIGMTAAHTNRAVEELLESGHSLTAEVARGIVDVTKQMPPAPRQPWMKGTLHKCRVCGCTDDDCTGCIAKTGQPCYWVEEDLCSACQDRPLILTPEGGAAR